MRIQLAIASAALGMTFVAGAAAQVRRIDGCTLPTFAIPLTEPNPRQGAAPSTCGALPVVEDAWTMDADCLGATSDLLESESYQFIIGGVFHQRITFVTKVKLPIPAGIGPPWRLVEDVVIVPCRTQSAQNPTGEDFPPNAPPPLLLIDDVTFPLLGAGSTPANEFLIGFVLEITDLVMPFGFGGDVDWFAIVDFDSDGVHFSQAATPDLDGNGCPDSAIELGVPGRFAPHTGMGEIGAGLVDYLLNHQALGLTRIDVFEPHPASPIPAALGGMQAGESHHSRPWCFHFALVP
ncbi:MAG: hypothetical protein HY292_05000 [Planctomycetes bacterium]|nr:hypothetical protein [Planctomycetota bacterium]